MTAEAPPPPPNLTLSACGGSLADPSRYPSEMYQGRRVFFCLEACRRAFQRAPDQFMAGELPHPSADD